MKARVKWVEGMAFMAEADSGHAIVMDGAPDIGGRNLGPAEKAFTMEELEKSVTAVKMRDGGFGTATDAECLILWRSLPPEVQAAYLADPADLGAVCR